MPKKDGTGPLGYGPRTGRGYGRCGLWSGRQHHYCLPFFSHHHRVWTKEEERGILEDELKNLEEELAAIKERLAELRS